ncbi:universal stress protein [Halovenus sp. WSH3]|uniref:Universal stress protein n=1 Tax=Halovenus carboxidivorans TaxID=2692199 RepID=A0A6B0T838_9EURY|nr:universal stress protein [Halovenus carboxidivorans]MXR51773.1 universal stress protein [Halovenus carboxidivorans]
MYDDILFPTDGSEAAESAFEHAINQAEAFDSTLHVLFVANTNYQDLGATGSRSVDDLRESGRAVVEEIESAASDAAVVTETHVEEGDPHKRILEYADETDMIVMGTRGRSGIDRYLLGSVTEKVVRTADVPVFTVRDRD